MAIEEQTQEDVIGELNSRIRVLEGKYNLLRDRVLVINQNMIEEYKKLISEIKVMNSEIREVKNELTKLKETIKHIVKELEFFARKEDVKVLEKYINMWNPIKFVTEKEVIGLIKEHLKEKVHEKEVKKEANNGKKTRGSS